ncbi:MAG: S8 family serine peptidase [Cyclobacteriaceae bacterium]
MTFTIMRRSLTLFAFGLLAAMTAAAQRNHGQWAARMTAQYTRQHAAAVEWAARHGKPVRFTDPAGRVFVLDHLDATGHPVYLVTLNQASAVTTNVVQLRPGGSAGINLFGKDMTVGVFDGGKVGVHQELDNRVLSREGDQLSEHATHVTGTLIASGINADARGMAPMGEALTYTFENDIAKMALVAGPDAHSLLVSNHSYGTSVGWQNEGNSWTWMGSPLISNDEDFRSGFYGPRTASIDSLAHRSPFYTIVWAAGNDRADTGSGGHPADCNGGTGFDCIIPEAVAKNVITVGAVEAVSNYAGPSSVAMSFFSSWGPTDDGRIKPDVTGDGVDVFSLSSAAADSYTTMSGTSMATPNVSGSLLLMQELYGRLHGGKRMWSSTLKALAIHTAKEAGTAPGPDYRFGWGLLDVAAGADFLLKENGKDFQLTEGTLTDGQVIQIPLTPAAGKRIKITLAWNDVPGTPVPPALDPVNLMLVNDLDIRLADDKGLVFQPWILDPGNPAQPATTGDNFRDNVEQIVVDLPSQRPHQLQLSHKGKLPLAGQPYSLLITYERATPAPTFYWVKDSGIWSDTAHWSLASGGASAHTLPGAQDQVIVDEHSFSNKNQTIALDKDVSITTLRWIYSDSSSMDFAGHQLTVDHDFTIATNSFHTASSGRVNIVNGGEANAQYASMANVSLQFSSGDSRLTGTWELDTLAVLAGTLDAKAVALNAAFVDFSSATSKSIALDRSALRLSKGMRVQSALTAITTAAATLESVGTSTVLNWGGVLWQGRVTATADTTEFSGLNTIQHLTTAAVVRLTSNHHIDTLLMDPGARLELAGQSNQFVGEASWQGTSVDSIRIIGLGAATIQFTGNHKYCFDYLSVVGVNAGGVGISNAGLHSLVQNGAGWLTIDCSEVMFPDFAVQYPCDHGRTLFTDRSEGPVTAWSWNFGDPASSDNTSQEQNPVHSFTRTGDFNVTLTVSNAVAEQQVTRVVTVRANTILDNRIQYNATSLFSSVAVPTYQWYVDGQLLNNTSRSLGYHGDIGSYLVVASDGTCNRPSDLLVITGLEALPEDFQLYPNPAGSSVQVEGTRGEGKIAVWDALGQMAGEFSASGPLDVSAYPPGIYVVEWVFQGKAHRKRLLVQH